MAKVDENKNKFLGRYGQWRLPAVHTWSKDRQGVHCLLGLVLSAPLPLVFGLLAFVAQAPAAVLTGAMVALGIKFYVLTYTFINYERSENVSINDHAYPDIFGYKVGSVIMYGVLVALMVWWALTATW